MSMMQAGSAACSAGRPEEKPRDGLSIRPVKVKTLEETLVAERLPVQWTCVMRFTLFPPQDNVIVADGSAGTSAVFHPIRCRSLYCIPVCCRVGA